jgi:hypothetical protein
LGVAARSDQSIDLLGKCAPFRLHLAQSLAPRLRQTVVLSRMRRFALHPVRFEQSFFREPSENGIDGALADDQISEGFEVLDDGQAMARGENTPRSTRTPTPSSG